MLIYCNKAEEESQRQCFLPECPVVVSLQIHIPELSEELKTTQARLSEGLVTSDWSIDWRLFEAHTHFCHEACEPGTKSLWGITSPCHLGPIRRHLKMKRRRAELPLNELFLHHKCWLSSGLDHCTFFFFFQLSNKILYLCKREH